MAPEATWKKEFERLNRKIDRLSATNEKLVLQGIKQSSQLSELNVQNKQQSLLINELKELLAAKDARIAELEEQQNKNSGNSSKPSSTDFFNKPKPSSVNKGGSSSTKKRPEARMAMRVQPCNSRRPLTPSIAAFPRSVLSVRLLKNAAHPFASSIRGMWWMLALSHSKAGMIVSRASAPRVD